MSKSSAGRVSRRRVKAGKPPYPSITETQRKKLVGLQKKKNLAVSKANLLIAEFEHEAASAVSVLDVPMESSQLCLGCGMVRPQGIDCQKCRG